MTTEQNVEEKRDEQVSREETARVEHPKKEQVKEDKTIEELKQQISILNDEIFKLKNSKINAIENPDVWNPELDETMIKKLKERVY